MLGEGRTRHKVQHHLVSLLCVYLASSFLFHHHTPLFTLPAERDSPHDLYASNCALLSGIGDHESVSQVCEAQQSAEDTGLG